MTSQSKTFATVMAALAGLTLIATTVQSNEQPLMVAQADGTILGDAANILLLFFLVALIIERACEVAMLGLTAIGFVPAPLTDGTKQPVRIQASLAICLILGSMIVSGGAFMMEAILSVSNASGQGLSLPISFRYADVVISTFVFAGGSEGIHRIIRKVAPAKIPSE